jgi:hypothetical protein
MVRKVAASLSKVLGTNRYLNIDVNQLESKFARPEMKKRAAASTDEKPIGTKKVQLLDSKRSTSIGIVMKRIKDSLGGTDINVSLILPTPPAHSPPAVTPPIYGRCRFERPS